jgi:hypothetical protein
MKELDIITLKSFLIALEQLGEPLPEPQYSQLQTIADNLPENLATLDKIAESYPPLDEIYQEIRSLNQERYRHRNKANIPSFDDEPYNTENPNFLVPAPRQPLTKPIEEVVKIDNPNLLLQKAKQIIGKWKKH